MRYIAVVISLLFVISTQAQETRINAVRLLKGDYTAGTYLRSDGSAFIPTDKATVQADLNYWQQNSGEIWNPRLLYGGFGARTTAGVASWNDVTNARSGQGYSLLLGTATGGSGDGVYYHPFNFEYSSKDGSGNMTQFAIPYRSRAGDGTLRYRSRSSGSWDNWVSLWSDTNDGAGSGMDADLLDGQQGSYYLNYNNLTNKPTALWSGTAGDVTSLVSGGSLTLGQTSTLGFQFSVIGSKGGGAMFASSSAANSNSIFRLFGKSYTGNPSVHTLFANYENQTALFFGGGTGTGEPVTEMRFYTGTYGALGTGSIGMYLDNNVWWTARPLNGINNASPTQALDVAGRIRQRVQDQYASSTKFAVFGEASSDVIGYRTFNPNSVNAVQLEGLSSSQFLRSDVTDDFTGQFINFTSPLDGCGIKSTRDDARLFFMGGNSFASTSGAYLMLEGANYGGTGAGGRAIFVLGSGKDLWVNANKVWHAGNDGASSGLDSDLLDGQQGSYYLDWTNFTNTPNFINTVGIIQGTTNPNGATLFQNELRLQSASKLAPGLMTTQAQTFEGRKTFSVPKSADLATPLVLSGEGINTLDESVGFNVLADEEHTLGAARWTILAEPQTNIFDTKASMKVNSGGLLIDVAYNDGNRRAFVNNKARYKRISGTITANYTLGADDHILICNASGSIDVELGLASDNRDMTIGIGREIIVVNNTSNNVVIKQSGTTLYTQGGNSTVTYLATSLGWLRLD